MHFFFGKFSSKLNSASQRNFHLVCASLIFFHRNVAEARFSYNKRIKGKATHDLITIFMFFEVKNDQLNSIFLKTNGSPKWRKKARERLEKLKSSFYNLFWISPIKPHYADPQISPTIALLKVKTWVWKHLVVGHLIYIF